VRLVEEVLAAGIPGRAVVVSPTLEATPRGAALSAALAAKTARLERLEDRALAGLASTEHPQGVIAVIEPKSWRLGEVAPPHALLLTPHPVILVLDAIQDPGNVGTAVRTAWALGAAGVVALPGTAELSNPKVLRGAMGATFRLPCVAAAPEEFFAWLADRQRDCGPPADGENVSLLTPHLSRLTAVVVGNEGAGLSPAVSAMATRKVSIPMRPGAESLNVGVAAGILLYQLRHDR
jgi:TrmH family RNA methyltransferase